MSKVLITGSKGKIGSVLVEGLADKHELIGLDLPEDDISDFDHLFSKMEGIDTVIHAAASTDEKYQEHDLTGKIDPANVKIEMNIFKAVIDAGVSRLIMASSVHADNFIEYEGNELITVPGSYKPTSPYGGHKIIVEEMGRFFTEQNGFEFIGVRFGGVTRNNTVKSFGREREVWLSHGDLQSAVQACVEAGEVPGKFCVFYAVSNNTGRIHSTDNPFGWTPKDDSKDHPET